MKIRNIRFALKGIINYLSSIALAVVFALYLSGRIGWFLVIAFLCAPVISVLMTLIFARKVYVESEMDVSTVCKGERFTLGVNVINDFVLPTPNICIDICDCPSVRCDNKKYTVSVMPLAAEQFEASFEAAISGPSDVGIAAVRITDYFGIFSFEPKVMTGNGNVHTVSVIPDAAEISADDDTVRRICEASAQADDGEDTVENNTAVFGGFPGYDSREYVPGDPLKRINWKQSVRRGKLLVRLDDETACTNVSVVLDSVFYTDYIFPPAYQQLEMFVGKNADEIVPLIGEIAVEKSIGIAKTLLLGSFSVNYVFFGSSGWEIFKLTDENDIATLRTELADYKFSSDKAMVRFPADELNEIKSTVSVFCTPCADEGIAEFFSFDGIGNAKNEDKAVLYAVTASPYVSDFKGAMSNES